MPIVYTPTVGQACQEFAHIFRRPRGLYVSPENRGQIARSWTTGRHHDVRVIVVTDGERILGLGDLGANGMGIPIGKLALYTACAGIHPPQCLPVTLDVGTDNEDTARGPAVPRPRAEPRLRGAAYDELVDEFVTAVQDAFPRALIQFEDFANTNAFRLLHATATGCCASTTTSRAPPPWRWPVCSAALRITGRNSADQRVLFLGAGEAAIGIADLIVARP